MQRRPTGMGQRTGLHYLEVAQNIRRYQNQRNGVPDVSSEEAALQFVHGGGSGWGSSRHRVEPASSPFREMAYIFSPPYMEHPTMALLFASNGRRVAKHFR
ncbi:unnamed protein product [Rotaria socialis]|uniref:Uncharacterized protein n=1 Tax=Rotaria socialis TaxID=392032 RepID=A0A821BRQ5_9BILA|nr:unnamed protein product [Rotaria socialis]CAF3482799.1 unnamed protein product [Rotaria socialis]CAF4414035.1 unnamed protein product [Rotaria socialis]CAF4487734.1 unnamed protein product [Rotaria socialis]CAF4595341.1 unnamed protein product [Rotaria socialis]